MTSLPGHGLNKLAAGRGLQTDKPDWATSPNGVVLLLMRFGPKPQTEKNTNCELQLLAGIKEKTKTTNYTQKSTDIYVADVNTISALNRWRMVARS